MIKLSKLAKETIRILKDKGFEAYAVGPCVRNSLVGQKPEEWDVGTSADFASIMELFPDAKVLSDKLSIVRLYGGDGEEDLVCDVCTFRAKGEENGDSVFTQDVKEDLKRRDFTVNALADNGVEFVDEFGGRSDIQAKLVRTIGSADDLFREEPIKMLKALRITAELGFDLTQEVYEAILKNHGLLRNLDPERFRRDFLAIVGGPSAGKALNMIVDMGMLGDILGEAGDSLTSREKSDLMTFCENAGKSKPVPDRRMGALLSILSKKKALSIIVRLGFTGDLRQHLEDVAIDLPAFHFAQQPQTYKKFIYEHAPMERSEYLLNLQKALLIIFDYSIETKIKSKMYLLKEFEKNGDPIFVEDLAIDANDLMEAGILDTPEECEKMLKMLIERLHLEPKKNTRKELFKLAKSYKKNKLKAYFRGVSWIH